MPTVTIIQPTIFDREVTKLRVAAYCRVSSSSEDQLNSYQAQLTYYSHKFEDSDMEELVDLYADEGITGTREDKRDEFQRLMKDCRRGKIDRIYTKSISRFARNTKDCLKNLRELKSLGITVFFEKENIDTANMTDEIMITILGGLAQEESVSISQNMRWACRKRMEDGTYEISSPPFGYDKIDGKLVVNPKQADIVKKIFEMYLSGHGVFSIVNYLNECKIEIDAKGTKWHDFGVTYILKNERYTGDSEFQKTYSSDTFPVQRHINRGEANKYYISYTHQAIISKNDFDNVQKLMKSQAEIFRKHSHNDKVYQKIIKCGKCGSAFICKNSCGKEYWSCRMHDRNAELCNMKRISEQTINNAYTNLHNKLFCNYKAILIPLRNKLYELKCKKYGVDAHLLNIHKEIAKLREQNHVIARLRTKGFMDEGKYQEQSKELNNKIRKLQAELKKITRSDDEDDILEQLDMLVDYFEKREHMMVSFEPETFDSMVDRITANQNELTFHLLGGIELKEKI